MRNDLLADIVTASGGTITDRNNRNLLLKDWLEAVQAPAVNYVARLNGADQYWQLSGGGVSIPAGGRMEFKFIAPVGGYDSGDTFFDNIDRRRIRILNGSYDLSGGFSAFVDGVQISTGLEAPMDGLNHLVSVVANGVIVIEAFGARYPGLEGTMINAPLFDLTVYDASDNITHQIPLTNKAQGATQLATVGNVNATMVGYSEDVWEVLPEPEPVNYVARLNGTDQYWQLSQPISLDVGDEVSFKAERESGEATSKEWFASGSNLRINVQANNKIEEVGGDLYLDGELVTNYTTEFPTDGLEHDFKYTITSTGRSITTLGASESGFEKLEGYVKSLSIKRNGVFIHSIPLTNKSQGATQLATVGNVNATMVGYNSDVWEQV
jgi:hypothetical protein